MSTDTQEPRKQFATGAVRGTETDGTRYDLITPIGLRRLAETYAEGAKKYGDNNWLKGFPASDLLQHAMVHVEKFRAGDRSEDHLAHAAWNLMAIMHFEETRSDLMDLPEWAGKACEHRRINFTEKKCLDCGKELNLEPPEWTDPPPLGEYVVPPNICHHDWTIGRTSRRCRVCGVIHTLAAGFDSIPEDRQCKHLRITPLDNGTRCEDCGEFREYTSLKA